ncbi:MAG: hypothetical protein JWM42_1701 [Burkholderia sp.]|nr:hypothetical protein [Burkholderia sp.]
MAYNGTSNRWMSWKGEGVLRSEAIRKQLCGIIRDIARLFFKRLMEFVDPLFPKLFRGSHQANGRKGPAVRIANRHCESVKAWHDIAQIDAEAMFARTLPHCL